MRLVTGIVMCVVALVFTAPAWAQDAKLVEKGEKLYGEQKCSMCHAIAGKGNAKGALDGVGSKLKADEIRAWIATPKEMTEKTKAERKPPMKSYAHLAKDDVDALVAYLGSLKKK